MTLLTPNLSEATEDMEPSYTEGEVVRNDYGTAVRYGIVVQADPVLVCWLPGPAAGIEGLDIGKAE